VLASLEHATTFNIDMSQSMYLEEIRGSTLALAMTLELRGLFHPA